MQTIEDILGERPEQTSDLTIEDILGERPEQTSDLTIEDILGERPEQSIAPTEQHEWYDPRRYLPREPTQKELDIEANRRSEVFMEKARGIGKKDLTPIERVDPHIDMAGVEREPAEGIPEAVEHGILGEAAAGLGRGTLGVIKTPFDIMDFVGELTGLETLEDIGEYGAKDIEQTISETAALRKSESISKDIRGNPQLWTDPRFYTSLVSEGIPHLAAMFIPGVAAAKVAKTAQLGTKGIKTAAVAGGLGASMSLTGGNTIAEIRDYEERTGETVPLSRKTAVVLGTSAVVGGLDYIPIFKIFGKKVAGNLVSRVVTSMALEGSTEGAQEIVSNFFKQQGYDPNQKLLDNVIEAIVGGALLGGGMGAVSSHTNFQDKLKGTSVEEVSKVLEKAENEIITNMKKLDEVVKKKDTELEKDEALAQKKIQEGRAFLQEKEDILRERADVFGKEITEAERVAVRAEMEPDINKFMRRAEKQLEAPIVEVIKKEAQETVDVLNDVAKLGEEARSKENIDRAKAVVKENPELFEIVKGAISVVKEKIPEVKEPPISEEVIDKAVPITKAQEKIEALTDEELETRLEKTTVPKIKTALKAEVKERKRLDKKIEGLPETMEEEADAAEIVLEQVDDDVGRTHDMIDRHQSNVIKYIKDVFSKDEVTIKKHIDLDIWSDELKKSLKKAGVFEKDISEGSTQHLVVRGLKLQNKLRKATDKYLQNNLNKEKNSSTTNALIQIEIDKRSKMSAKKTKPVMKKKGGKAEDIAGLVPVTDSDEWFTDGRVIINSKPTEAMKKKLNDFGMEGIEVKKLKEVMEVETNPVELKFFGGYSPTGEILLSDTPLFKKEVDKSRWTVAAFQTKDGKIKHLNQFALSVATNRFPDAKIGMTSDENALIFYENNKPVALVSTLRKGEPDIDKEARKQGFLKKKPVVKPVVKIEDLTDEELRLKRRKAKASKTIEALEVEIKKRKGIVVAPIPKKKPKKKPANVKKLKDLISKKQTPAIQNEIDKVRDDIIEDGIAEYGKGTKGFKAHLKENYKFLSDYDMATIINEFEAKAAEREIDRGLAVDSTLVDMEEQYSTDIVKPQDTITRTELRKMFAPMKNVVTGINKKGNMYFKVTGRDPVEIKEVDYISDNINTTTGPIPVGSYLDNVIKLKVKGKGARAGSSTAWHEFMHYIETNGIITDNDIKVLNNVIDKKDVTFEDRATYVGNNLADFKSQKSSIVRRAFRKIADFVNAIRDMIKKTRTAKGVLRDIRTGKILKGKPSKVQVQEKELYHKKTAYKESLEPISESDYEKSRDLSKPGVSKIVNKVIKEPKDLIKQPDKFFGMISTRLNKICPELMARTRELEWNKGIKMSRRTKRIKPFLKIQKKMQKKNRDDFSDFGYALANSDINKVNELVDKYKIHKEYLEVTKLLKELYNEGLDVGLELGVVNYYFPRGVSDSKGLVEEIRGAKDWDVYSRALEEKALATSMVVSEMHPDLKASIIANTLEINSTGLGGITSTKHRKYKKIPGDLYAKFYMNQMEALTNHVIQMTTLIENRRFLGKVPKRISEKRRKLAHAQLQIKECNDNMSGKLSITQTKRLERFKKIVKDNKSDKETLINAKQHIRGLNIILGNKLSDKNIDILQERKNKYIRVEKQCDSYLQKYAAEHKDGIGQVINKLIESGELKPEHEQEAHDMLHSLINPGSMYGGWATLRNIGYISVMANPLSAVTQMEDLRYPMYISPLGFPKHLFKALTGTSRIKREMVGLDKKISQEFSDAASTSKAVTKLFKWVGITLVDAIGKDATLNATYGNYRKRAKKNPSKFKNDIKVYFKEETDSVINDLNNDNITENVLKLVYYRLLDFQPVAATETSEYYQKANNLTGIYMLKTYDLKALDVVRNEVYNKIKSGSVKEAVEGVSNLMRLAMTFFICGVPRKMIQFWILGKAIDMEDIAYERLMGLFFASKYTLKQIKREGIINVFTEWLLPPTAPWSSMFRDVSDIYHDKWKGSEVVKNIPFLGKIYYYRWGKFAGNKDVKSGKSMRRGTARRSTARRGTARRSQ